MIIRFATPEDREEWLRLRSALWPDCPLLEHREEMEEIQSDPRRNVVLVSEAEDGHLNGLLEVTIRAVAPGCTTRTIGYLEGWYVEPAYRRQGVGRMLVEAAERWARSLGCTEMASDTEIANLTSQQAHERLGYEEIERVVHFYKPLPAESGPEEKSV
ncbi:MAG: aminoglycoside 6'-N-acetyltransferase [Anaerolineales bacterium]